MAGTLAFALAGATPAAARPASTTRPVPRAVPEVQEPGETSGPALGLGAGYQTPVFGGQLMYYLRPGERPISFAPYVGVGWWPGEEERDDVVGYALGVMGVYGRRHRLLVDVGYGLAAVEYRSDLFGNRHRALYGATLAPGYEYMSYSGIFFRATFGGTYRVDETKFFDDDTPFAATIHLGTGYKFY